MVETNIRTSKRITDVIRELGFPEGYYIEVKTDKPHPPENEWHHDILARKIDPETSKTIDTIKVRLFRRSSILEPVSQSSRY